MIKFLASVRDAAEARMALAGGAHVIDLKEPSQGALGAVSLEIAEQVVRLVAGRTLVSATIGDHPLVPEVVAAAVAERARTGVDLVKIGVFDGDAAGTFARLKPLAEQDIRMVAVVLADRTPDPESLIPIAAQAGFVGIMMDTAGKGGGGLLGHVTLEQAGRFVSSAKEHGLLSGLAGSLTIDDIDRLRSLVPDYMGFRGALCTGGREGALDDQRLRAVAARIATADAVTAA
jgi:uncharacterized protein (UPF0264 family)